jgi:membrane protease YdiL (CAAX protease family)
MVTARSSGVVRPPLIERCFLLTPVFPVAVLALVVSSVFVLLMHVATWMAAVVVGTIAALVVRTARRTWNSPFSVSPDSVMNRWRFRTTVIPVASIRMCHPVKLLPGSRHSPLVLGLVVEGKSKPLGIPATFRLNRAERQAVVQTMAYLGICIERASEYIDQN